MTSPDIDVFPTITYIDPLTMPQFTVTNVPYSTWNQVNGDWLLNAFISKLDQEIVDDVEEWKEKKETVAEIFNAVRTFGWCVYQQYNTFDKVFTPMEKIDWIKKINKDTGKNERIGINVAWTDEVQNTWNDFLYFDDEVNDNNQIVSKAYLFVWRKGNGKTLSFCPRDTNFAIPDLDLSVHSLAIQIRQIQNTLAIGALNPYFLHIKYGSNAKPAVRANIIKQLSYAGVSIGIGAQESALKDIIPIENGSVEVSINSLDTLISFFASTTRLPLSFYFGEKQIGSGMDSGNAENVDEERIMKKKEYILQHFAEQLTEIARDLWEITLPDLYGFYEVKREEAKAEKEAEQDREMQKQYPNERMRKRMTNGARS